MKKIGLFVISLFFSCTVIFGQQNLSVDVDDDIYNILDYAQIKGLCAPVSSVRPYTVSQVLAVIDEILMNEDKLTENELHTLESFKTKYLPNIEKKNGPGHLTLSNNSEKFPVSFLYDFSLSGMASGGIYTDSSFNKGGFDQITNFAFSGDITKYISYNMNAFFTFSYMPLEYRDDYFIGYYWYGNYEESNEKCGYFADGKYTVDDKTYYLGYDSNGYYYTKNDVKTYLTPAEVESYRKNYEPYRRTIKKYFNHSVLPYSYHKPWSGQIYFLSNLSASGLEGWATEPGISGGITAEVRSSFFDNHVVIGAGRTKKEWAGMDNGSSLALNSNAQPFFECDFRLNLFPWMSFSYLCGILEYPNQDFINENAFSKAYSNKDEATIFQNAFSINMLEFDWKYIHLDMGTNVVWPKRFEIGYMFPLILYVEYQNHIGDYDNMAIFGDIKFKLPGIGSVWGSLYMDEINPASHFFHQSRVMYAGQLGSKFALPFLPFGTFSMRYTKVEPYCYTHNSVNYTPWYDHYVSTAYINNGEGLGYYLDPNSDELFIRIEAKPGAKTNAAIQYQFIRHGADYGSQQVPGSSFYSEMSPDNRDELKKYFLRDGAYNWIHIINLEGSVMHKTKKSNFVEFKANIGFMYSYWTMIDNDKYDRSILGNNGNCADVDEHTPYYYVSNDEYPVQCGVVLGCQATIKF